jgi:cytochrome c oxidase cbb3-type subunit IV
MVSGIVTAILLACFIAGAIWAFSARRRAEFDHAARLPLEEPPTDGRSPEAAHLQATLGKAVRTEGQP